MTRTGMNCILTLGLILGGCTADDNTSANNDKMHNMDASGHISWTGNVALDGDKNVAILKALRTAISDSRYNTDGLQVTRQNTDALGNTHLTMSQHIGGVAIEGAAINISLNAEHVYALHGRLFPSQDVPAIPAFDRSDIIKTALSVAGMLSSDLRDEPTITPLYRNMDSGLQAVLRVDLNSDMSRPRLYIAPSSGVVLSHHDRMHHSATEGSGHTLATDEHDEMEVPLDLYQDGSYFYQRDTSRNGGSSTFRTITTYDVDQCGTSLCGGEARSADNEWPKAHNNSAHYLAGQVLDFWSENYNLDSFNNRGGNIRVFQLQTSEYDNAYWNGVDSIVIGDGSYTGNGGYYDYLGRADVLAHELGHAVEGAMGPDLLYQYESGALSEATADMSAAFFEQWFEAADGHSDSNGDWLIGEDAIHEGSSYPYRAMRNMADPKEMGDPDTWGGQYYVSEEGCEPSSSNDNCGVHSNSGVGNFAFYLQAEGGEGVNDHGINYNVEGIGMEKAHAIMFQAVRYHMNNGTDYQGYYDALMTSAGELYGEDSSEQRCVQDSMNAVGLRVCGNNSCEIGESFDLCPSDCAEGEEPVEEPTEDDATPEPEESYSAMVEGIDFSQTREGRASYNVYATISLDAVSETGETIEAAGTWVQVSITGTDGNATVLEGTTDYNGDFTVVEYKVRRGESIQICVLDASHPSYPYSPSLNEETCATHTASR